MVEIKYPSALPENFKYDFYEMKLLHNLSNNIINKSDFFVKEAHISFI